MKLYVESLTSDVKYKIEKFVGSTKYKFKGLLTYDGSLICDLLLFNSIIDDVNIVILNHKPSMRLRFVVHGVRKPSLNDERFFEIFYVTTCNVLPLFEWSNNELSVTLHAQIEQYVELPSLLEFESVASNITEYFILEYSNSVLE